MSVDKIVEGLRGTAHNATFIGHNVLAPAIRKLRTIIEGVKVILNTGSGNCLYFSLIQGTRLGSSASIEKTSTHGRLVMRSTCFGWVTSECQWAFERGCKRSTSVTCRFGLFLVKEAVRQRKTKIVRSLPDQIWQLVNAPRRIKASDGVLEANTLATSSFCYSQNALLVKCS